MNSIEIMKSIRAYWKLDALQECNDTYFYSYEDVNAILSGEKCYAIGRKGMGKTAICQHIVNTKVHNHFADKLSFKNFPFNDLYALQNNEYTPQSQYISLWKYLIYSTVCKLMSTNENIDNDIKTTLLQLYPKNDFKQLSRKIKEWTGLEFGVNILGYGGNVKVEREEKENNQVSWIEKIDILEDIIFQFCDEARYYIIFDELDEDYNNIYDKNNQQYEFLLTGLFKAVQDIRNTFRNTKLNIMPIVFLRNDIYARLNDADKNKWSDFKIDLDWDIHQLKQLIAFRISKDAKDETLLHDFDKAWHAIFTRDKIAYGDRQQKQISTFDFISNSTHLRPRDFIKYIQACCKLSIEKKEDHITNATVREVDREFSNYLKNELRDEVYPILPEIDEVFNILSNMRKQLIKPSEFVSAYQSKIGNDLKVNLNVEKVLEILFDFSIIGNQHKSRENRFFFKYLQTNMTYNRKEVIVIHRGLLKSLQIF